MKNNDTYKKTNVVTNQSNSAPPILKIDYALYQHYLDDSDLNENEKQEFLDTIWSIIVSFVDLGFGVHPVQQVLGEEILSNELLSPDRNPMVKGKNKSDNKTDRHNCLSQEGSQ